MRLLSVIIFFLFTGILSAQDDEKDYDRVYGLDPLLYNGKKYMYFLPPGTGGHQYLSTPDYFLGSVTIRGETFGNITLNYDVYNQQLLLQYANGTGAMNIIELSKAWLESFRLGSKDFESLTFDDNQHFYQVLGDGQLRVLYFYRKDLKLDVAYGTSNYTFSPVIRSSFVLLNGVPEPFRSRKSLIRLFDSGKRPEIQSYLRKNRIRVKKASDPVMTDLINFISTIK